MTRAATGEAHDRLPRRRVVKDAGQRRAEILRAGRQVFDTTGFAQCTVDDITAAAQIGKGTFYRFFESKDHLLGALWEEYVDAITDITRGILGQGHAGGWWPPVDQVLSTLVRHAVSHAGLHRTVYGSANATALEICKQANHRVIDLICHYVTEGAAAGAFRARDPARAFRLAYHGIDGLLDDLIADGTPIDTDRVIADVLELVHRALGDTGTPAQPATVHR